MGSVDNLTCSRLLFLLPVWLLLLPALSHIYTGPPSGDPPLLSHSRFPPPTKRKNFRLSHSHSVGMECVESRTTTPAPTTTRRRARMRTYTVNRPSPVSYLLYKYRPSPVSYLLGYK